uniref:Uncharacterized protein n=1 Tax=Triticum urartu TaxID=4572 RepID=A0A8R7PYI9_TRIUA
MWTSPTSRSPRARSARSSTWTDPAALAGTVNRTVAFQVGLRPPARSVATRWRERGSPERETTAYTSMAEKRFTSLRSLPDIRVSSSALCAMASTVLAISVSIAISVDRERGESRSGCGWMYPKTRWWDR